jgi:hypothetical protein
MQRSPSQLWRENTRVPKRRPMPSGAARRAGEVVSRGKGAHRMRWSLGASWCARTQVTTRQKVAVKRSRPPSAWLEPHWTANGDVMPRCWTIHPCVGAGASRNATWVEGEVCVADEIDEAVAELALGGAVPRSIRPRRTNRPRPCRSVLIPPAALGSRLLSASLNACPVVSRRASRCHSVVSCHLATT